MVRRCSDKMAKLLMVVFNGVFLVCGIAMLIVGGLDLKGLGPIKQILSGVSAVTAVFIVVGVVVCVISFLGFCGAIRENNCMVTTFMTLMILILIAEIAVGIAAFAKRDDVEQILTDQAKKSLNFTDKSSLTAKAWDDIQISYTCCGADGPDDYNTFGRDIPDSCCKIPVPKGGECTSKSPGFSGEGCIPKIKQVLKEHFLTVGVVAVIIGFIEVIGIIFACCLRSAINEKYETV